MGGPATQHWNEEQQRELRTSSNKTNSSSLVQAKFISTAVLYRMYDGEAFVKAPHS